MRTFAVIVFTLWVTPLHAQHCYSIWKYPTPQHCNGVYARAASQPLLASYIRDVPTPPYRPDRVGIPLPDMSAAWATDDKSDGMQRIKALKICCDLANKQPLPQTQQPDHQLPPE
jgi:hypothetical protein